MELFLQYIKQRRKLIVFGVLCGLIFLVSFLLYHLPVKAVLYPVILCVGIGVVFAILDFRKVQKKQEALHTIRTLTDVVSGRLPRIEGVEDAAYQEILSLIGQEQNELRMGFEKQSMEMIDYYTLWAHQIKTPIASMRLTLQNEDSPLARKLMAELFHIEQYVEMVLVFLRLDSKTTDYLFREYPLDEIIRQAVKKFAGEFIGRKLSLEYEPVDVKVITDEKWLSFVIEQVLSNALKYTPSGKITISMEKDRVLCIRDTGMGIAPEDLPRIFEKGYTGYQGRQDKRASGIGLYLCKRICRNLGHGIRAESVPGQGTVIRIDLNQRKTRYE